MTVDGLLQVKEWALAEGSQITIHMGEHTEERETSIDRWGIGAFHKGEEIGFLGPDVVAAHCVMLDEAELEIVARTGTQVSYNPVSNAYLGNGIAPITRMLELGIDVSLAARRQEDEVERRGLLLGDVAALEHALAARLHGDLVEQRHGLAREREQRRAVGAIERGDERARGLLGIGGADDVEIRDDAQAGDGLDRLVRRAVLADADAVVREDVDDGQVAERREADARGGSSRRRRGTSRRSGGRCRARRCRSGSSTCRARGCRSGCCGPCGARA